MAFLQPHTANLTPHAACVAPEPNQPVSAGKKHHSQADDLWARFKVPEWGVFCHWARLRNRLPTSTEFNLTVPGQDMEAAIESETFSPEDERVTYRNDADMTLNHRKSRL